MSEILSATISLFVQLQLERRSQLSVSAVEAAAWLNEAGILSDSGHRPGLPLRNFLRDGSIIGQRQESNHRWYIDRIPNIAIELKIDAK